MDASTTHLAINPVRADRADDFEHWLRTVVAPAVRRARPSQDGRWHVLRADQVEDGVVVFAFVFDGGPGDEWALHPVLEEALGADGAANALREMDGMLQAEQTGWSFVPVRLDGT